MDQQLDVEDTGLRVDRSTKTLRELTLEKLRDAILDLRFQPGERLVERVLCERLGVSRTVVREVLRHLEAEGLVEIIPQQGPAVARPAPDLVDQIYELRALLEAEAARACAERAAPADVRRLEAAIDVIERAFADEDPRGVLKATTDYYELMFDLSGKSVAWGVVRSLNARINHLRAMTIATPGRGPRAIAEMRRIVAAIGRGDGAAAHAASSAHVAEVAEIARERLGG